MTLIQLTSDTLFLTDGGLETTLVFHDGIDLPDFAAFPLLDTGTGRQALHSYYVPYLDLAEHLGLGIVLDTATWRANLDWGTRLGYDAIRLAAVNRRAVEYCTLLAAERSALQAVINGVIGPRGDGYVVGATMSASEAAAYHGLQARAFAEAGAHMITATTMTYTQEAVGVTRAAIAVNLPVVVSFTVETDGRLPSGQPLGEAIIEVDQTTGNAPAYYMVNCAHPAHFTDAIDTGAAWAQKIKGIRANASRLSHAELDVATELDRGDIDELAHLYRMLHTELDLRVVGGCCGTDHEHIAAIARALATHADRREPLRPVSAGDPTAQDACPGRAPS